MEEDLLSPALIHTWLTAILKRAFNHLEDVTVILSSHYPNINIIVSRKDENGNPTTTLCFCVRASVPINCQVPTIMLRHPLPMQMPFSQHGMRILQQLRQKLAAGKLTLSSVPHQTEQPERRLSSRQSRRSLKLNPQPVYEWRMDYSAAETEILKQTLRLKCMGAASEAFDLITSIKNQRGEDWDVITPLVLQCTMLWLMKRATLNFKTVSDWFFGLLNTLKCVVYKQYCPGYFEPNANVFTPCEKSVAHSVARDIDRLLEDCENKRELYYARS